MQLQFDTVKLTWFQEQQRLNVKLPASDTPCGLAKCVVS